MEKDLSSIEKVIKEFDEMPFGIKIPFNQEMMWGEREGFEADGREEFKTWLRTVLTTWEQEIVEEHKSETRWLYHYLVIEPNEEAVKSILDKVKN